MRRLAGLDAAISETPVEDCMFYQNNPNVQVEPYVGGGINCQNNSCPMIRNCEFVQNMVIAAGGGVACTDSSPTIAGCLFQSNYADAGGGIRCFRSSAVITDCFFMNNESETGCAIYCGSNVAGPFFTTITGCTFVENHGGDGTGVNCSNTMASIAGCTFVGQMGEYRPVVRAWSGQMTVQNTIIAFNDGPAVACPPDSGVTLACCDIFRNVGGDWVGCIADQYGINGNISEDPLFCDAQNDDFTLDASSPCAPPQSGDCGLIGAWPVGCGTTGVFAGESPSPRIGLRVYPNPVRTDGVIEWAGGERSAAILRLYDPLGRLVLTRDLGNSGSDRQEVQWKNLVGESRLSSGIYFLELTASPGKRQVSRIIVAR